jgi:hypothetical protein
MAQVPEDYKYDVFFSYKRHNLTLGWTKGVHERIVLWLSEELNREATIFVDDQGIAVGDRWPDRLREAVKLSRCMIAVWSPLYFQSDWCMSEWQSFRARETQLQIAPHGLIAPLKFHDGEHFPADARSVQWTDVSDFASTASAFWGSSRALELEDKLKTFVKSVATIVGNAPQFDPNWPLVDQAGLPVAPIKLASL